MGVTIIDKEWEKMRWDVRNPDIQILTEYPELADRFDEFKKTKFTGDLDLDTAVRIIVLCYHKNSPIAEKIADPYERMERALTELRIEENAGKSKDKWSKEYQQILENRNMNFTDMKLQFLRFEKSMRYTHYILAVDNYYKTQRMLQSEDMAAEDLVKQQKTLNQLITFIENEAETIFAKERDLAEEVPANEIRRRRITPEANAA